MPELQWEAEEDPDWGHKHEEQEKSKHSPRGPVELNRKTGLAGFSIPRIFQVSPEAEFLVHF